MGVVEVIAELEPEVKVETKTEDVVKVETKPEAETAPVVEVVAELEPEVKVETKAEDAAKVAAEPKPEVKVESVPEPEAEVKAVRARRVKKISDKESVPTGVIIDGGIVDSKCEKESPKLNGIENGVENGVDVAIDNNADSNAPVVVETKTVEPEGAAEKIKSNVPIKVFDNVCEANVNVMDVINGGGLSLDSDDE